MDLLSNFVRWYAELGFTGRILFTTLSVLAISILIIFIVIKIALVWHRLIEREKIKEQERAAARKAKRDKISEEKRMRKMRKVHVNNFQLNNLLNNHRIINFIGPPGAGKSSSKAFLTHFRCMQINYNFIKNEKYYKLIKPWTYKQFKFLQEKKLLPVYTNGEEMIDLTTGFRTMPGALDIVKMRKRQIFPSGVICLDEEMELSKDLYREVMNETDPEKIADNKGIKRMFKHLRHYGLHIIMTDHGGNDLIYTAREIPIEKITCLETHVNLSKKGRIIQRIKVACLKYLPGWIVSKPCRRLSESLTGWQKFVTALKMFLPGVWADLRNYFLSRDQVRIKCNNKYHVWSTKWQNRGQNYWFDYNNKQTLKYNHLEFNKELNELFDANGDRKAVYN